MNLTRVKICGITNPEDAAVAVDAGADALGFNTWKKSVRYLDLEAAAGWIGVLPPFVMKVAVLVNPTPEEAQAIFALPFIDLLQFHGAETADFCRSITGRGAAFIKAIGVKDQTSLQIAAEFGTPNVLLDAHAPGTYGGTGRVIDWSLGARFAREHPQIRIILSGGLNPDNVAAAVREVRPYGVDVASGVEVSPGRKDSGLVRRFIQAVKMADAEL